MPKRPEFAEILDTLKSAHMAGIDADRVHDLNSITGIPFVRTFAELASDPNTTVDYLPILADKVRVALVLAGTLAEMGVNLAEEHKVDAPPELLRFQSGLAKILGKTKGQDKADTVRVGGPEVDVLQPASAETNPEVVKHGKADKAK